MRSISKSKELGTDSTPAAPDPMILACLRCFRIMASGKLLADLLSRYLQSMMSAFAYPGMQYAGDWGTAVAASRLRVFPVALYCRWFHYGDAADAQLQKRRVLDVG